MNNQTRIAALLSIFWLTFSVNAQPTAGAPNRPTFVTDQWRYTITPYLWAIGISGSVAQDGDTLAKVSLSPSNVLSDLKMAGMVQAQAHKGRYGLFVDAIYGDLGKNASTTVSNGLKLDASTRIQMSMVTLAPSYTLYNSPKLYLDGLVGARYFWLNAKTTLSAPQDGLSLTANNTLNLTAAVAGVKGRLNLGDTDYFIPFYLDVGAGQSSSFTTQAYLAVGKSFDWGDVTLGVKNVYYQYKANASNINTNMLGAAVGVTFRF